MKRCPQCGQMFDDNVQYCPIDGAKPVPVGAGEEQDPFTGVVLGGKYRLEQKVGEGGMGKIYLSRHITLNKKYAVKMLNPEYSNNAEAIERFRREAVTAGELDHPNIINVNDIDYTDDGQAYIVMEFLDGRELRDELKKTPIVDPQRALRIIYQVSRALDAAHAKGIIHRDLKPENIFLIDRADQKDVVKILDFGISKIKGARASNLTQTGMVIGTPHYMAPEQARGDKDIDTRVDTFALGAIAYEMFTGRLPVNGESPTAILMKILLEEPPPPESINPNLPPGVSTAIKKAMAKEPGDRFQSCMEFVDALRMAFQVQQESLTTSGFIPAPVAPPSAQQQALPPSAQQAMPPSQSLPIISGGMQPAGTGATPMTWAGTGAATDGYPPKKKSSAVFIVIPVVLFLLAAVGVGAYLLISGMPDKKDRKDNLKTAKSQTDKEDSGDKAATDKGSKDDTKKATQDADKGKTAADGDQVMIKFCTDPEGATVLQKMDLVERELCKTECEYEFKKSKKKMKIILVKSGYHDEELEIAPDVPYKEVIIKLLEKSKKKKAGGSKIKVVSKNTKPIITAVSPGKDKKAPVIRLINSPKKPDNNKKKKKKKPIIRIIP